MAELTVHDLAMKVQQAWDEEFTRPPNTGVDYRQARIAVETVLKLAEVIPVEGSEDG